MMTIRMSCTTSNIFSIIFDFLVLGWWAPIAGRLVCLVCGLVQEFARKLQVVHHVVNVCIA